MAVLTEIEKEAETIERFAKVRGLRIEDARKLWGAERAAAAVLPDALERARAAELQAAKRLEAAEAERARVSDLAGRWNSLLDGWERTKRDLANCADSAASYEAVAGPAGEIDCARQILANQGQPVYAIELGRQLAAAKVLGPAFRRLENELKAELANAEAQLVAFATENKIDSKHLPEHLR